MWISKVDISDPMTFDCRNDQSILQRMPRSVARIPATFLVHVKDIARNNIIDDLSIIAYLHVEYSRSHHTSLLSCRNRWRLWWCRTSAFKSSRISKNGTTNDCIDDEHKVNSLVWPFTPSNRGENLTIGSSASGMSNDPISHQASRDIVRIAILKLLQVAFDTESPLHFSKSLIRVTSDVNSFNIGFDCIITL